MGHIPYGYKIVDGNAVIDEKQAEKVIKLFKGYTDGLSLKKAAETAGLDLYHGSVGNMLRNKRYLGDDYYPQIVKKELFDKAEEIRNARAKHLGRIKELPKSPKPEIQTKFFMKTAMEYFMDPFQQAEYIYSLIESKGLANE